MRFVLVAAAKDLRRRLSDPAALAIWIGIPLLLGGLMSLVLGGDNVQPRATVLVVDQDGTLVSGLLIGSASQGQLGEMLDLESVTLEEGQRRMDDGDATAMLVLPKGFQSAVLNDTPAQIRLVTNPSERILPGIIEAALEIALEAVFYGQRLFGETLRRIGATVTPGGPSNTDVAAISVEINNRLRELQGVALPPVLQLEVTTENPQQGPSLNFAQLFLPGTLFMAFLFIASGMSTDVWEEHRTGTLRRALTTPQAAWRLLAGKLLAGIALMAVIGLVALAGAVFVYDVAWPRVPGALAWSVFAGGALLALLTLLQTMASSHRAAEMLGSVVTFPMMMLGGSFFPFESMPGWMVSVGQWTPNGLAVMRLKDLLYGTPSAQSMLIGVAAVGVPAVIAFALAARRLRSTFATA